MLHGSAPRKRETSATLHGNACADWQVQMDSQKRVLKTSPKPLRLSTFWSCLRFHWSTCGAHTQKETTPSGCQGAPKAIAQSMHFPDIFCKLCSSGFFWWPLPACSSLWKQAKKHWFYHISDALAEPNMGHQNEYQKLQNERHAAWERSNRKKSERHAA